MKYLVPLAPLNTKFHARADARGGPRLGFLLQGSRVAGIPVRNGKATRTFRRKRILLRNIRWMFRLTQNVLRPQGQRACC